MSRKVQLLVGFLVLTTLLAGWQLLGVLHFPATLAKILPASSGALADPEDDTDHDGLVDTEESYWNTDFQNPDTDGDGYKDGEEVASGHDPLIAGPDDVLLTNTLTGELNELVVAGLYDGSLKPGSPEFESSLTQIADAVVDAAAHQSPKKYSLTVVPATQANTVHYRTFIVSVLRTLEETITPVPSVSDTARDTFGPAQERVNALVGRLASAPVPATYKTLHEEFVSTLADLGLYYHDLTLSEEDALRRTSVMGGISQLLIERLSDVIDRYGESFRSP